MLKSGGGVISNTSSILGRIAMPGAAVLQRLETRCGRHHQDNGTRTRRAGYPSEFRCSGRYRNTHDRPFRRRRGYRRSAATCFAAPDGSSGRGQGNCRSGPLSGLRRSIFHDRNLVASRWGLSRQVANATPDHPDNNQHQKDSGEDMIHVRKAKERGDTNHGWLDTYHKFSFSTRERLG